MGYRQRFREIDLAGYTVLESNERGAFVVNATRGLPAPKKCSSEEDVLAYAGKPALGSAELLEVLEYVKVAPVWLSCPFGTGSLLGGVDVTDTGLESFEKGRGFDFDYSDGIDMVASVGVSDGTSSTFIVTLDTPNYKPKSISAIVFTSPLGVKTTTPVVATEATGSSETLTSIAFEVEGSFDIDTKQVAIALASALPINTVVSLVYKKTTVNISHSIFTLSPDNGVFFSTRLVSKPAGKVGIYKLELYKFEKNTHTIIDTYEYTLVEGSENDMGELNYIENVLDNNMYISYKINTGYTGVYPLYTVNTNKFFLTGGVRNTEITAVDRNESWDFFKAEARYPTELFIETSADPLVASKILDLVTISQKTSFGVVMLPSKKTYEELVTARTTLGISCDNLAFYCNWAIVINPYTGTKIKTSLIGSDGANMARMSVAFDSLSPAGLEDEDGLAGEIKGRNIVSLDIPDLDDNESGGLQTLDLAQINPRVQHPSRGFYTRGDKTSLTRLTDTSFIGTRRLLNFVNRNLRDMLLTQEFKFNNKTKRQAFEQKFETMVSPILEGKYCSLLTCVVDSEKINGVKVRQRRFFAVAVAFQATPNSQVIDYTLIRMGQDVTVADLGL